ncbi:hypothetical protein GNI_226770 [Gregarina niphandrodes]|uniref:Uncharacterized protein n=1 Tax=Gregarina niphandrodes TaxID=110365 RepID=A0A023AVY4_GRENI|nr:hypothetical protein GNI_226770 [Gregarina niphandrodes]EZG42782.1 hypothetical protein GNI_226770 [Gregarina niphandrodes]|eukprot:XP_011133940.1 hypothetical protein GNI_226770 [Gregarina niphandrodes]
MVQTRANTDPEQVYAEFFRKCKEEKVLDMTLFQLIPLKLLETRAQEKKIALEDLIEVRDKYLDGCHPDWVKKFKTLVSELNKKAIPQLDLTPLLTTREFRDAQRAGPPTFSKQNSTSTPSKSYIPPPMPRPTRQPDRSLEEVMRGDSSVYSSLDSGPRHRRDDEQRYGFEAVEDIESLMFDPMSLIAQLKQKKTTIPKLFEMKLRIVSQAIYHPSIENSELLIDALDTIRNEGVISQRQRDRLLISIIAYGKDATVKRMEAGTLDRPLNIYAKSLRKKPGDTKAQKKPEQKGNGGNQQQAYKGKKTYQNKNRRNSYKPTETTNNWTDTTK